MNPLRQKMASLLTETARKGVRTLDPDSPCAKALKKDDIDDIIKEDIDRICEAVSFAEAARVLSLAARWHTSAPGEYREMIKTELKRTAKEVAARIENGSGELRTPEPCRYLLLDL